MNAYSFGRSAGQWWKAWVFIAACGLVAYVATGASDQEAAPTVATPAPVNPLVLECAERIEPLVTAARLLLDKGDPESAHRIIGKCTGFTNDPTALAMIETTLKAAAKVSTARAARLDAERAKAEKIAMKEAARQEAALKAEKRKEGVTIGMSQQDALDSSWGRPQKVNRTISARGTREQWVYGGSNYLYFEDGVLVSIQN